MARRSVQATLTGQPDPDLTDGDILLRPWALADVPDLAAAGDDPEIARFTHVPSPYSEDDARAWIESVLARTRDGRHWSFAVTDASTGKLLGSIGIRDVDGNGQIGYWVARDARGRGVATRALTLVSRWAFEELGYVRVQLLTAPENAASQRVAENAGFTREGVLRSHIEIKGRRRDGVMFGLVAGDLDES